VLPNRGSPQVWLLAVRVADVGALGKLVAEANAAIEAAEAGRPTSPR